jgi:hypothetical protein
MYNFRRHAVTTCMWYVPTAASQCLVPTLTIKFIGRLLTVDSDTGTIHVVGFNRLLGLPTRILVKDPAWAASSASPAKPCQVCHRGLHVWVGGTIGRAWYRVRYDLYGAGNGHYPSSSLRISKSRYWVLGRGLVLGTR